MGNGWYMIIVIDGYNVLKQALHKIEVSKSVKDHFINQLSVYGRKKGHTMQVVFDGGLSEWPDRTCMGGVIVIYSGIHDSADDWIKKYMHQHKGHDLLLVSTDRELGASVRRFGIACIDAMDFYGLLQRACMGHVEKSSNQQAIVKTAECELPELDELMHQESRVIQVKLDDRIEKKDFRKSAAHTVSKKEREMIKKLKKL